MIRPLVLSVLAALPLAGPAFAVRSDWTGLAEGELRLLAERGPDGAISGGVEIALEPGWHTYWRYPGASGIPPRFDFAGSQNVGRLDVTYPVPERYDDGTGVALIYRDSVVFSLSVVPADRALPVVLRLDALVGVCREICIPAHAETTITVPVDPKPDPLTRATLEGASARFPGPPQQGSFAIESADLKDDTLHVAVLVPGDAAPDLFVEPPEGWYVAQPKLVSFDARRAVFDLPLGAGVPKGETASGKTFRFLLVSGAGSIEETVTVP